MQMPKIWDEAAALDAYAQQRSDLLSWLEYLINPAKQGATACSVKLASKTKKWGTKEHAQYRCGDGPWRPSLADAIMAHRERFLDPFGGRNK